MDSTTQKYRKKPVVIEAMRFDGSSEGADAVIRFTGRDDGVSYIERDGAKIYDVIIETIDGNMYATPGDWVIKGVLGEFYPCKPDQFAAVYEPVSPSPVVVRDNAKKCPDGLLPDGPVCPRCGGNRGASGIDGGTWVHWDPPALSKKPDSLDTPSASVDGGDSDARANASKTLLNDADALNYIAATLERQPSAIVKGDITTLYDIAGRLMAQFDAKSPASVPALPDKASATSELLVDGLWNAVVGYVHTMGPAAKTQARCIPEDARKDLLRHIASLEGQVKDLERWNKEQQELRAGLHQELSELSREFHHAEFVKLQLSDELRDMRPKLEVAEADTKRLELCRDNAWMLGHRIRRRISPIESGTIGLIDGLIRICEENGASANILRAASLPTSGDTNG